ncbi:extensin-like [Dendrobium catenatum]|uniref:extensin-like n=1 Tax=Dendrobium catenatum TaxID=906689 RepID=UPI0009F399A8|nr:extensin-like [Dendrobium catenatum]
MSLIVVHKFHRMKVNQHKMASGDDRKRRILKNIFGRRNKKIIVTSYNRSVCIEGTSSSQPATQSQPSLPILAPAAITQSQPSPQFYSPDPHLPSSDLTQTTPFYPYFPPPPHGVYPTYPPYSYPSYVPPPAQPSTTPPQPATAPPQPATEPPQPAAAEQATEGRILIEPDGDT